MQRCYLLFGQGHFIGQGSVQTNNILISGKNRESAFGLLPNMCVLLILTLIVVLYFLQTIFFVCLHWIFWDSFAKFLELFYLTLLCKTYKEFLAFFQLQGEGGSVNYCSNFKPEYKIVLYINSIYLTKQEE